MSWFDEGLKFECQPDCYECCLREGIVRLKRGAGESKSEVESLASFMEMDEEDFREKYVHSDILNGDYIEDGPNGGCPLWGDGCTVYSSRPMQCMTYPFWPEIMKSERRWDNEAKFCPGIGKGRTFSPDEIQMMLGAMKGL